MNSGYIKAIIGPNGAGKTTIFNIISGMYAPTSGSIWFQDDRIDNLAPHFVAAKGVARTFQNVQIFDNMSVLENVMVGHHPCTKSGFLSCILKTKRNYREEKAIRSKALHLLEFVGLEEKKHFSPSGLTFHEQRLIEIARAMATECKLLLLDEPAAGLNARETIQMGELIYKIKNRGVSVLLVEHDIDLVMDISEEVLVLNSGMVIAEGPPEKVQTDEKVIMTYLGEEGFVTDKKS